MRRLALLAVTALAGWGGALADAVHVPFGSEWQLYRSGPTGRAVTTSRVKAPRLVFDVGRVSGTTDCLSAFSATYGQRNGKFSIGPLQVMQRRCAISAEGVLERRFLEGLEKVKRVGIKDDFLVLLGKDGYTYTFKRVQ